jgi:hypothetical protein
MSLLRTRFTVRRLMVVVAVVASSSWVWVPFCIMKNAEPSPVPLSLGSRLGLNWLS